MTNKKKIEDAIMATDAVLHTDWLTRLDAFVEADKKEALTKLRYFYWGVCLFFAILFIGFAITLRSGYANKVVSLKKEYDFKYNCFIDKENLKIDSVNKWSADNRPIQVQINKPKLDSVDYWEYQFNDCKKHTK